MREVLTEQHDLAGREGADMVAHEERAFTGSESGQFHLDVVMPVLAQTSDALSLAGVEQRLDLAEIVRPAEHPEGAAGPQGNALELAQHLHFNRTICQK